MAKDLNNADNNEDTETKPDPGDGKKAAKVDLSDIQRDFQLYKMKAAYRQKIVNGQVMFATLMLIIAGSIGWYVSVGGFRLSESVATLLDQDLNALFSLGPAFLGGLFGAVGRSLLTGDVMAENMGGILGAGFIAVISILSFESGLISIVAEAYFADGRVDSASAEGVIASVDGGGVYASMLLSIVTGMFAYNLFSMMQRAADKASS